MKRRNVMYEILQKTRDFLGISYIVFFMCTRIVRIVSTYEIPKNFTFFCEISYIMLFVCTRIVRNVWCA